MLGIVLNLHMAKESAGESSRSMGSIAGTSACLRGQPSICISCRILSIARMTPNPYPFIRILLPW